MDKNYLRELDNVIQRAALMIEGESVNLIKSSIPPPLSPKTLLSKLKAGYSPIPLIRTGELLQSIRSEKTGELESVVGAFSKYAIFHEFGVPSINLPQRPFMVPALDNMLPTIEDEVKETLRRTDL